jgi:hypothetical protein
MGLSSARRRLIDQIHSLPAQSLHLGHIQARHHRQQGRSKEVVARGKIVVLSAEQRSDCWSGLSGLFLSKAQRFDHFSNLGGGQG